MATEVPGVFFVIVALAHGCSRIKRNKTASTKGVLVKVPVLIQVVVLAQRYYTGRLEKSSKRSSLYQVIQVAVRT
jgi:hypothetical protein